MANEFSELTQDFLYCHKNCLLEDDVGHALRRIFEAGVCDEKIAGMFKRRKSKHEFYQALYGVRLFKTPKLAKGDYSVGFDTNGNELFSYFQFHNAHSLTTSNSGGGKTNRSYYVILQVAKRLKGMWLFDTQKCEYGKLKPKLAETDVDLKVLSGRDLKFNPLQVPSGVALSNWISRNSDMLIQVFELPKRASRLLQTTQFMLYEKFDTAKGIYPTLFDLFEAVKNDKESNAQARMAVLDNLEPTLLALGPGVLAYRRGWSSDELAKRHIAYELEGCSETDKNLILNGLILSEFISRISRRISNKKMDLMIFVDEAERLCSSKDEFSAIANVIGSIRGSGIGLDLSVQSTQLLPQILSNTAVKHLGRCGSYTDYDKAGKSLGLSSDQISFWQRESEPGTFVGRFSEGEYRYPFIYRIPLIPFPDKLPANIYEADPFPEIKTVYASEFDTWGQIPEINLPIESQIFDSPQDLEFCKAVADSPMQPSSTYPKIAGISSKNAKQIRERLIAKGFIAEHKLDSAGRGRSTLLLDITSAGFTAIQKCQEQMK